MENTKSTRLPKQQRSREKKNKIQQTALELFCEYGFFSVTTNQIAKAAGLSIGTLYEYYQNKEEILYDILDQYYTDFLNAQNRLTTLISSGIHSEDKRIWLHDLIHNLICSHRESIAFNMELHSLYFRLDKVKEICDKQKESFRTIVFKSFVEIQDELHVTDCRAAAIMFCDVLSSTVDRIVLYPLDINEERIIEQSITLLINYLF